MSATLSTSPETLLYVADLVHDATGIPRRQVLMIVHHAASTGDHDEQARLARHYYGIWCLLNHSDTLSALLDSPGAATRHGTPDILCHPRGS